MTRWLLASAMAIACAIGLPAKAQAVEELGTRAGASADAVYSNLATFRNQSFAAGGATQQFFNTITRMAADDLNLVGTPPYQINGFRFTVTNLNTVDVSARMLVRFYLPNGSNGGPGTLIQASTYNPIVFTAGRVGTIKTSTRFVLTSSRVWAAIAFDDANGSTGATAAQLDNLAQGIFSPAALGTSANQYFVTNAAGSFAEDNPVGLVLNFAGGPPADFGWEILAEQAVDLSITNSDGVDTVPAGSSLVYTITARNAGPDPVFNARVVDTFPTPLTCSWTCAGSAGNTCAASGTGGINDGTVSMAPGGAVTYTATCAVPSGTTGTVVNTAAIVAPGTAVDVNNANNTAVDTDLIVVPPPAVTRVTFVSLVPNPTLVGQSTTATARVDTSSGNPPPTGVLKVILNSTGGVLCTITLPGTTCAFTPTATGDTELLAQYDGDAVYPSGLSNVFVMSIAPVPSVVSNVSATPSPTAVGTATTATATVATHALFAPPTGTVNVRDNNSDNVLCTITLPATSCAFTPTTPGAAQLTARYLGDANYKVGSSATLQPLLVVGITSAAPPGGSVGSAYSHTYTANASLAYAVTSGALPPGLALAGNGVLSGIPTAAGTFTGAVTGSAGGLGTAQSFSIAIAAILPGAPTIGSAVAGDAQATVAFTPPASNGGSSITSYTVTSSPGGLTASGTASPLTVSGLANGTTYSFTVTATNAVGTGPPSAPSNSVTPAALPGAPTSVVATSGNAQATIAFTPPASNGGFPITSYTVTSSPGGISASGPASPIAVGGLANGTAYTFTVTATTAVGTGPASAPSNSVTPAGVPGAPTNTIAAAGNTQAAVAFTPPASNGSPITSYAVTSSPGGIVTIGAASPIIVSGLANGTTYTFTVTATNAVGTGPASAPSNGVTPGAVPGAPTIGVATAGNTQATVVFTPPTSTGGSPITSYTVTSSPGNISVSGSTSPITVNGLTNGTAYSFTVTATNAVGTGLASAPSNLVTPAGLPGAPTILIAAAGNTQAGVVFAPPASNGGSTITSYTATSSPGGITASGASSPIIVSGLTNGTAYTFTVTATNAVGTGPASAPSNSVTPAAVPGPPTIGTATAGNAQATVTFTPPASTGGSAITSYTATSSPGGITASGAASPITVGGLTNGTAYTFTVTATNSVGTGLASAPSNSVTPATVPAAPTIGTATPGNGQVTIAFAPPASNGGSAITSYRVTCGTFSASGAASPLTVTGLTNGTAYNCSVTATNAVGTGPASAVVSVTPGAVPGAPTIGTATAGDRQATITFTPPVTTGGSPITSYTVTASPGGISASGPASPITVTGLTNGIDYTFTVTATNAAGTGPPSAPSNVVTPATVPGAPTIVAANAGNGRATIAFTPPSSSGGAPIRFYTATCGAFSASGAAPILTVTGLTNGTTYSCTVTARNVMGAGPPSAPVSVTPAAVVRSYIAPSATGSGTIAAVFTGGGPGCTFTTSDYIPVSGGSASPAAPPPAAVAFPHGLFTFTLDGCNPASTVTFTIVYPAPLPPGTQYWKYGPEPGTPAPHWYVLPATITGSQVVFSITDGAQGDDDLVANGTIVDQGGPGAPAGTPGAGVIQTPTLSQWALMLLAALLLGFAAPALRRRS